MTQNAPVRSAAKPARKRGPNRGAELSPERILAAALAMTREAGLDDLSMRKLASRLSVGTMSAYYHFETRDALVDEIINAVLRSATALPPMTELTWQQELKLFLRHFYDVTVQYPGVARSFYDRSILEPGVRHPDRIRVADRFASIFRKAGMDPIQSRWALAVSLGLIITLVDRTTRRAQRAGEFKDSERAEHDLYREEYPSYWWSTESSVSFEEIDVIGPAIEVLIAGLERFSSTSPA